MTDRSFGEPSVPPPIMDPAPVLAPVPSVVPLPSPSPLLPSIADAGPTVDAGENDAGQSDAGLEPDSGRTTVATTDGERSDGGTTEPDANQ